MSKVIISSKEQECIDNSKAYCSALIELNQFCDSSDLVGQERADKLKTLRYNVELLCEETRRLISDIELKS